MVRIELKNVGVRFQVRPTKRATLKETLIRRLLLRGGPSRQVHALHDVSLTIDEGERLGVLGHNGAGKSTLLRLIAGIYPPTAGRRRVEGRVSSLFEITHGFEFDASGWENIAFRGYLQGETPRSIRAKMPGIAEFTELGEFLDMPVRCYSSGMLVRLAFAIATAIEPEILLVDEALGAGDLSFQHKARQRMKDMMARARLIVMVSHDLNSLQEFCGRAIWLDHGRIQRSGPVAEVVAAYSAQTAAA
jgi:ABC-type polysaccharide/polyol phosphate transport system ATPase subunit